MYKFEVENPNEKKFLAAKEMQIGQIGRVVGGLYNNTVVIRIYEHILSLENVHNTWDHPECMEMLVDLLPKGSKITLTVED